MPHSLKNLFFILALILTVPAHAMPGGDEEDQTGSVSPVGPAAAAAAAEEEATATDSAWGEEWLASHNYIGPRGTANTDNTHMLTAPTEDSVLRLDILERVIHPVSLFLDGYTFSHQEYGSMAFSKLRCLYLSKVEIHARSLGDMPQLDTLTLNCCRINFNGDRYFTKLPALTCLVIEDSDRPARTTGPLPNNAFTQLTTLKILRICRVLDRVTPELFSQLTELEELQLTHNQLPIFPPHSFQGQTSLTYLCLSGNRGISLDPDSFEGLGSLKKLDLSGNRMTEVPTAALRHLRGVTVLSIAANKIAKLEQRAFTGMDSLQDLRLRSNEITSLDPGSFEGLGSLKKLDLSGNRMTEVPQAALAATTSLESVNLSQNKIRTLSPDDFSHPNLNSVTLSYNILSGALPPEAFWDTPELRSLFLADNPQLSGKLPLPLRDGRLAMLKHVVFMRTLVAETPLQVAPDIPTRYFRSPTDPNVYESVIPTKGLWKKEKEGAAETGAAAAGAASVATPKQDEDSNLTEFLVDPDPDLGALPPGKM